jgi:hypothetical protein
VTIYNYHYLSVKNQSHYFSNLEQDLQNRVMNIAFDVCFQAFTAGIAQIMVTWFITLSRILFELVCDSAKQMLV